MQSEQMELYKCHFRSPDPIFIIDFENNIQVLTYIFCENTLTHHPFYRCNKMLK